MILFRYFNSIEEIRETIEFPPKEAFYSELKQQHVNHDEYIDSKELYDKRRQLRYPLQFYKK